MALGLMHVDGVQGVTGFALMVSNFQLLRVWQ